MKKAPKKLIKEVFFKDKTDKRVVFDYVAMEKKMLALCTKKELKK